MLCIALRHEREKYGEIACPKILLEKGFCFFCPVGRRKYSGQLKEIEDCYCFGLVFGPDKTLVVSNLGLL
jgi:hypothetical protein